MGVIYNKPDIFYPFWVNLARKPECLCKMNFGG